MGTHRQREPQQPHRTLGHTLGLGELCLVLHCNEEALQPHLSDAVSWSKKQTRCLKPPPSQDTLDSLTAQAPRSPAQD